jgi:hypothetical protein
MEDKQNVRLKLEQLDTCISELRNVLNEVCCTLGESTDTQNADKRLAISQCLDELIVEYMLQLKKLNENSLSKI